MVTKLVTDLKVSPSDWLTNPLSVKSPWQIWYRYKGKLVKLMGMNREKDYSSRVKLTLQLINDEESKLSKFGFNPLKKTYLRTPNSLQQSETFERESLGFLEAINLAYSQLKVEHSTLIIVKSCIKYISESSIKIGLSDVPINQIKKSHLKLLMSNCEEQRKLSSRNYNAYRSYLMMLFEQLDELEMVDHNPVKELKKKKEIIKLRKTLTNDERVRVREYLQKYQPHFYRFIQIFFHSGSRRTELLSLKVKDVNLETGEFVTLVKKGNQKRYVKRVIKNLVKGYWVQQLQRAESNHYVFSIGLLPGPHKIRVEQVSRRWKRFVKDKFGISADLYSLKHLNTDETASLLDLNAAAIHNGHTSTQITKLHYAFGEEGRMMQRLKDVKNEF